MKRLTAHRPSPALIISILALVLATVGTGYAASKLQPNSVGTKQLKKNAVTAKKIKKNAVTTAKIKSNAVTGTKVDEATLGTVPSAASAGSAASAATAANAATASSVAGRTTFSFFMAAGIRDVITIGPFTIRAKCTAGGTNEAELQLYTAVDNAAMQDESGDQIAPFNVADNPARIMSELAGPSVPDIESGSGDLIAVAPDGTTIATENHGLGIHVAGHLNECFFAGTIVKLS